jgi:hypothetical protein
MVGLFEVQLLPKGAPVKVIACVEPLQRIKLERDNTGTGLTVIVCCETDLHPAVLVTL